MARPRDLSIRRRLVRTTLLATGVALLLASATFVVYDVLTYREAIARRLTVAADIVGANSVAAILFDDRSSAARTLAALRAEPHIASAAIYTKDGRLFASYLSATDGAPLLAPKLVAPGVRFSPHGVVIAQRLVFEGAPLGTVVLESDLEELWVRLRRYALIVASVGLTSLAVALLVASRLQRSISGPILSLAATARAVSEDENYSVRAEAAGHDETGLLIATFNEMLDRIQRRDAELVDARASLERRVEERTAELTRELAERRRAEREIKRIQEMLAAAQAMAGLGAWEWDVASKGIWWSDEVFRLFGVDPASFVPTWGHVRRLVVEGDRGRLRAAVGAAVRGAKDFEVDYAIRLPDGSLRHHHAEGHPVAGATGAVTRVRGLVQDVTERRRSEQERERLIREQALREEAETGRRRSAFVAQVASVLASSLDWERTVSAAARLAVPGHADWALVDELSTDGSLRRVAIAHHDRTDEELEPLRRTALQPGGDCPSARAIAAGRTVLDDPTRPCEDDAHERLLDALGRGHLIAVPFFTEGRPRGVLVWCRRDRPYDTPDVLLAEEFARRAGTAVEHATLYQEAQEANRLKDEFLATLSHELRTPLHAIVGWAHMLRTGSLDAERTRRAVESIDRNAHAQSQLISDVLDVSRIVAGKLRLNLRRVDLRQVIEAAADTVRPAAEGRRVRLEVSLPASPRTVTGDADRLQQVVWNLLANAIKFVPPGGEVSVALEDAGSDALLRVVDDGPGIRSDFLPHVFERFRQADSSSTRPHGGLGLGLAIVRHLVELHGGSVEARNREDRSGAVFSVRLPLQAAPGASPAPAPRPAAAAGGGQSLAGLDVLLVDDEPDSREIVATALEMQGARVRLADGAEGALAAIRARRPGVLLSDVEMPGIDGYELLRRVRALPPEEGGDVPAAALTAYASLEHRARALEAGFDRHIPKPVEPAELVAAVAKLARLRGEEAPRRALRILVVDDNADVAESLQLLLASPAREVATAADGSAALTAAADFRPDVALLDLGLPGMDGCELARRMRALPGLEDVRLVALSGFGSPGDRERTNAAGFERHLVKPVDPGELLALLDELAADARRLHSAGKDR